MTRILVTGFEPFGPWAVNSSWAAVSLLAERRRGVEAARLPVDFRGAAGAIRDLVRRHAPGVVLLTGLTPDPVPRLERLGRAGPLAAGGGPCVRRGRWPFSRARARAQARGVPLRLSVDAGGYVCDTTYWAALGTGAPRVAFLHLPPTGGAWTPGRLATVVEAALGAGRPDTGTAPGFGPRIGGASRRENPVPAPKRSRADDKSCHI